MHLSPPSGTGTILSEGTEPKDCFIPLINSGQLTTVNAFCVAFINSTNVNTNQNMCNISPSICVVTVCFQLSGICLVITILDKSSSIPWLLRSHE